VRAYVAMLEALHDAARFGVRLDLAAVGEALQRMGSPHRRLGLTVHVGGTNGKGSTSALLAASLKKAGFRTGLFTSPHLARFTERIRIDGTEVDPEILGETYERLQPFFGGLTFFEQTTCLAFEIFTMAGVRATVLEVGLGGRLDATNVVDADVSVVTGVALDHQEVLGGDLAAIAREKAGIFKPGKPAVIGPGGEPEAVPVLIAEAERRGALPFTITADLPEGWTVGLAGEHQRANAACALAALIALDNPWIGQDDVRAAFAAATWPGRLEKSQNVMFDGAHNPQGARALAAACDPAVLVVGISADKDARGILEPLVRPGLPVIATQAPSPRALPAADLCAIAASLGGNAEAIADPLDALVRAQELAHDPVDSDDDGLILVCGSLYLVGALRALVLRERVDPVLAQDPAARR
jgi:dihydrofolate synthase/folylpolyglutamate synthase